MCHVHTGNAHYRSDICFCAKTLQLINTSFSLVFSSIAISFGMFEFRKNLKRIYTRNKLSNVQWLESDLPILKTFKGLDPDGYFSPFQKVSKIIGRDISDNKRLFQIAGERVVTVFPNRFEIESLWKKVSGEGTVMTLNDKRYLYDKTLVLMFMNSCVWWPRSLLTILWLLPLICLNV